MNISKKQNELLINVFRPFSDKYDISLNEFTNKLVNKNSSEINSKDLNYILKKTNNITNWDDSFVIIDISFKRLKYIIKKETENYIIGTQIHENGNELEIISFKKLMILDYDNMSLEEVEDILKKSELTFLLYHTKNGFHAYCISHEFNYSEKKTLILMNKLKCDEYYIGFSKHVGFVTRLQKKNNREEEYIEKFIKKISGPSGELLHLKELVDFKDSLLPNYG